jgi:hypothetical protein
VSGAWIGAGGDRGCSQYTGEIWIDFGRGESLRPIIAAGAGLVRLDDEAADGELETSTFGVGVLRATLQYRLPVDGVDARVAFDATGSVPAVAGKSELPSPWLVGAIQVGVGF